jgi:hypothetical protein
MKFKIIVALSLINSGIFIGAEEDQLFHVHIYDRINFYDINHKKVLIRGQWHYMNKEGYSLGNGCSKRYYEYNDKEKKFEKIVQGIYNKEKDIAILEESKAILEKIPGTFKIKTNLETKRTYFVINNDNSENLDCGEGLLNLNINTTDLTKEQKIDLILEMKKCINPEKGIIYERKKQWECIENLEALINKQVASETK